MQRFELDIFTPAPHSRTVIPPHGDIFMKRFIYLGIGLLFMASAALADSNVKESIGTVTNKQVTPPLTLSGKGSWLIEINQRGGFAPRFHRFVVTSNKSFTVLSSSPSLTSQIEPQLFSRTAEVIPSIFSAKVSTHSTFNLCMDCVYTDIQAWQVMKNGETRFIKVDLGDLSHSTMEPVIKDLISRGHEMQKGAH